MPTIQYDGRSIPLGAGESVLDGLLREGVDAPHSCRSGVCQACLMRAVDGSPPAHAQVGLKETLQARGFFLACQCVPQEDMTVSPADDEGMLVPARVQEVRKLGSDVARLLLEPEGPFEYMPGQFVHLVRNDGLVRSYSVASLPTDGPSLEVHVRRIPGGRMSEWIHNTVREGERVHLRGPAGSCCYVPGRPEQSLLLAGTGTGLAPLYGILRDALTHGHTGRIALFHGGIDADRLYLVEELRRIAASFPNVTYTGCVLHGEPAPGVEAGPIDRIVGEYVPSLDGWRAFLAGDPALVNKMRKQVFLAGASRKEIHADAFVTAGDNQ